MKEPAKDNSKTFFRRYKPYPAYKDSGVEELGEVPKHWGFPKLKRIASLAYGDNFMGQYHFNGEYKAYGSNGIIGESIIFNAEGPCIIIGRKGSFGKINYSSRSCFAIDTTFYIDNNLTKANIRWLYYCLQLLGLDSLSKDSAVPGLSREEAYGRRIPYCDVKEQQVIAAFLNRETAKIDALIAKQERLIELLQEKRAALITQAVTKGLDPNVPMKDSGLEWLGEIPAHWGTVPLKRLGEFQGGAGFPDNLQGCIDEELPFYKVSDTNNIGNEMYMKYHNNTISTETASYLRAFIFPKGTIVFPKVGAALLLNKRRILTRPSCIDNNMMGFIPCTGDLRWLYYWMCGLDLGRLANPGAVPSINESQLRDIVVPLPTEEEQKTIGLYLTNSNSVLNKTVDEISKAVSLLREYRTALISAAVTGKIDVREEVSSA